MPEFEMELSQNIELVQTNSKLVVWLAPRKWKGNGHQFCVEMKTSEIG